MHDAYEASPILKLTVQIESMAAYGKVFLLLFVIKKKKN